MLIEFQLYDIIYYWLLHITINNRYYTKIDKSRSIKFRIYFYTSMSEKKIYQNAVIYTLCNIHWIVCTCRLTGRIAYRRACSKCCLNVTP